MSGWIRFTDKKPTYAKMILIADTETNPGEFSICCGVYIGEAEGAKAHILCGVEMPEEKEARWKVAGTFWMEIPEPPDEDEE